MRHIKLGSLLCIIIGMFASQVLAQDSVALSYKFKPGDVSRYRVKEVAKCDKKLIGIGLDCDWDGILYLRVTRLLPNGDAELEASYASGVMKMQGQTRNVKGAEVAPLTLQASPSGIIRNLDEVLQSTAGGVTVTTNTSEGGEQSSTSTTSDVYALALITLLQQLPTNELRMGDSWTQEVPSPTLEGTVKAQYRLTQISYHSDNYGGTAFISSIIREESKTDVSGGEKPAFGRIDARSNIVFSTDQGRVVSVTSGGRLQVRGLPKELTEEAGIGSNLSISYTVELSLL